jgi:hypothetical protein
MNKSGSIRSAYNSGTPKMARRNDKKRRSCQSTALWHVAMKIFLNIDSLWDKDGRILQQTDSGTILWHHCLMNSSTDRNVERDIEVRKVQRMVRSPPKEKRTGGKVRVRVG